MSYGPLISVVTATYNRSNVLQWAIRSVLWQTYTNWELWVIGDACTDDTEEVVKSLSDLRIRFYNLPENVGEQSGPNNEGFRRSFGEYIAFLNHDDLWFPDHLEKSIEFLVSSGSDFVYSLVNRIHKDGRRQVNGIFKDRIYQPGPLVPASCWLLKRSLMQEIGPWRYYKEIYNIPSQDWLFRVWKAGKKIQLVPHLTVVAFGGTRPENYALREEEEQRIFYHRLKEENEFREIELVELLVHQPEFLRNSVEHLASASFIRLLRALLFKIERPILRALKIDPSAYKRRRKLERKGQYIDRLRRIRGLEAKKF